MKNIGLVILLLLLGISSSWADNSIDVRMLRSVNLGTDPVQVASTADGQRIYVLTEQGEVRLFSTNGEPLGSFDAGPGVTGITPQGNNRLILEMGQQKQLLLVALDPIVHLSATGSPVLGAENAPVTITIFDDFECPHCAKAVPLVKEVLNAYPDQVRLVYKHFPLGMHKHARDAAIASIAADRQGKFWPLHDLLFANHNKLSPQKITELAAEAGLDMDKFEADRKNPLLQQQLNADLQQGKRNGVRGTPTIFINDRPLAKRSRDAFDQAIKAELARLEQAKK